VTRYEVFFVMASAKPAETFALCDALIAEHERD